MVLTKPQHDVAHNPGLCDTPDSFGRVPNSGQSVSDLHTIHHQEQLVLRNINIHLRTLLVRLSGDPHYVRLSDQLVNINRAVLSVDVSPAVQDQPAGHGLHRHQD